MPSNNPNRVRATSARLPHKNRNFIDQDQKSEFIQRVYAQMPILPSQQKFNLIKKKKSNSHGFGAYQYTAPQRIPQQALIEQNKSLKKRILLLQQNENLMKSKLQTARTKNNKLAKNLNIQFENQILWNGPNIYLVTGVKNQYENLKKKYSEKCQEFESLKKKVNTTMIMELQLEIQKLKKQNKKLLECLIREQNKRKSLSISNDNKISIHRLDQLQQQKQDLEKKVDKFKSESAQYQQLVKIQQTKLTFFQKLIVQKDNALHALSRNSKTNEKQKISLKLQLKQLNQRGQLLKKQYEQKIQKQAQFQKRRMLQQRQIFQKTLQVKVREVQKLQKQVAYLTTLLSYWKPLDEQKNKVKYEEEEQKRKKQLRFKQQQEKKQKAKRQTDSLNLAKQFVVKMGQPSIPKQQPTDSTPREPYRADRKRSAFGEKSRNVKQSEVQEIGQMLRLRMLAQRVSIEQLKALFDYTPSNNQSEAESLWKREYITMKECRQILKNSPFYFDQEQSKVLSRYLIEDVIADYVYCDDSNQNKRSIVKSILKNLVRDYDVSKPFAQIQSQTERQMNKYRNKVATILQQMYPQGEISKKKLLQIFVGSGFEINEQVLQYILGKLVMKSDSLSNLKYRILFKME